jgi:hypothetical protein
VLGAPSVAVGGAAVGAGVLGAGLALLADVAGLPEGEGGVAGLGAALVLALVGALGDVFVPAGGTGWVALDKVPTTCETEGEAGLAAEAVSCPHCASHVLTLSPPQWVVVINRPKQPLTKPIFETRIGNSDDLGPTKGSAQRSPAAIPLDHV